MLVALGSLSSPAAVLSLGLGAVLIGVVGEMLRRLRLEGSHATLTVTDPAAQRLECFSRAHCPTGDSLSLHCWGAA